MPKKNWFRVFMMRVPGSGQRAAVPRVEMHRARAALGGRRSSGSMPPAAPKVSMASSMSRTGASVCSRGVTADRSRSTAKMQA